MQNWLISLIVNWLAANVTKEKMELWVNLAKAYVLPFLRTWATEIVARLRVEAQKSDNTLDDTVVDLIEKFFNALLPDNPATL